MTDCEGACARHGLCQGPVSRVRVTDPRTGKDWGEFWYCWTACENDVDSGFQVDTVPDEQETTR